MKKLIYFSLLLSFFFIFSSSVHAETITSFNSDITVQKNGKIHVIERIDYDFGYLNKHGIYRFIPFITKNTQGKEYKMDIQLKSVKDEEGNAYSFSPSNIIIQFREITTIWIIEEA